MGGALPHGSFPELDTSMTAAIPQNLCVDRQFPFYLGSLGAWYVGLGLQMVMFPWLVAVVLQAPPHLVGIA